MLTTSGDSWNPVSQGLILCMSSQVIDVEIASGVRKMLSCVKGVLIIQKQKKR
jgi:hypothetical protein